MDEHIIKEDVLNILRILSSGEEITQRDISQKMDLSLGKTNYLLKALILQGFVKVKNFSSGINKLKKVRYILTQKGLHERLRLAYYFLQRKEKEYLAIKKEVKSISQAH
jgi:EPS-associated MarR family transcriptional regulator